MIPYGRQDIRQEDIDAVSDVLRSDFLTQGPTVPRFERGVAERVGAKHALAVNSATSALHIACLALGLGPGDTLWTVPNSFVASANCARYCSADVDFVDIDPVTWNLSVSRLREKLEHACSTGRLPKILIPVHFAGQPTEQEAIWELAQEYGIRVIEDASHSVGAARRGEPVGSCRWSDMTVFSFHPVKIITSAEGGMVLTNDDAMASRLAMLRSHGITRDEAQLSKASAGPWYYEQQLLGFNYRMTDVHAALGLSQLNRLDEYVARRNDLAQRYDDGLRGLPITLPTVQEGNLSSFHLYVVRLGDHLPESAHRCVHETLRTHEIGVNLHYMPVHLQPYYRALGFRDGMFPEAERHGRRAVSLPLFPGLSLTEQDKVMTSLTSVLSGFAA